MTQKRTLIAVVNARSRKPFADAIRETWKPLVPEEQADVLFFVGRGEGEIEEDTVVLDCDDSYSGLPEKVREIIRWAYNHEYDFMLKCDDDVVIKPKELLASGYDSNQYTGRYNRPANPKDPYEVPFGFNYWLSRRCMEILKDCELPKDYDDEKWVAENLYRKAGILLSRDDRYKLHIQQTVDVQERALRPPSRRPGRLRPYYSVPEPDYFSWCVYLDVGVKPTISMDTKVKEFRKLFKEKVMPKVINNVPA